MTKQTRNGSHNLLKTVRNADAWVIAICIGPEVTRTDAQWHYHERSFPTRGRRASS